jgi:DNA (cytosine-5)-methyltransferase 1
VRPRLLDLFCGAGGAAVGYQRAGFYVVGVDIAPQPRYAGDEFFQGDALEVLRLLVEQNDRDEALGVLPLELLRPVEGGGGVGELVAVKEHRPFDTDHVRHGEPPTSGTSPAYKAGSACQEFDAIHASPPCQAYSVANNIHGRTDHPDLIAPTRELLEATGLPYVIENVPRAPLLPERTVTVCGLSLGMNVKRHRLFETNFPVMVPPCHSKHAGDWLLVFGHTVLERGTTVGVAKGGGPVIRRKHTTTARGREAMGIDWMNRDELSEAIPPTYTELIGHQLLAHLKAVAA